MSFGDPWFYIVLLGAAALVYALLLPGRKAASPKTDTAKELEATLEHYMAEIEKENEELIDLVAQMKQEFSSKQLAQQEQIAELRQRLGEVEFSVRQSESRMEDLGTALKEKASSVSAGVPAEAAVETSRPVVAEAVSSSNQASALADSAVSEPLPEPEETVDHVRSRYPELFDLYEKGKSIDMIAKATGLQRGEVQLILQLAKKEESQV